MAYAYTVGKLSIFNIFKFVMHKSFGGPEGTHHLSFIFVHAALYSCVLYVYQ